MTRSSKACCLLIAIAAIVGIAIYALAAISVISVIESTIFFPIIIGTGVLALIASLFSSLLYKLSRGCPTNCCGYRKTYLIGSIGMIFAGIFTSLIVSIGGIAYNVGVSACFAFLTLLLGGIYLLARAYSDCECNRPDCCDCACSCQLNR